MWGVEEWEDSLGGSFSLVVLEPLRQWCVPIVSNGCCRGTDEDEV